MLDLTDLLSIIINIDVNNDRSIISITRLYSLIQKIIINRLRAEGQTSLSSFSGNLSKRRCYDESTDILLFVHPGIMLTVSFPVEEL